MSELGSLWTKEETIILRMKYEKMLLLQAQRYTGGQSTSLRAETVEALLRSLYFTMKHLPSTMLLRETPERLLAEGERVIRHRLKQVSFLYQRACRCRFQEQSLSLQTTLQGIGAFFRAYEVRFFPAELPCEIDYQLAYPVSEELQGVDWLRCYLDRLLTEDMILRRFPPDTVRRVLAAACPEHRELLVNLFGIVSEAALGIMMTEGDFFTLNLAEKSRRQLAVHLTELSPRHRRRCLEAAGENLARRLELPPSAAEYLCRTALDLVPRIEAMLKAGADMQQIFPAVTKF